MFLFVCNTLTVKSLVWNLTTLLNLLTVKELWFGRKHVRIKQEN